LVFLPPGEPSGAEVRRAVVAKASRRARLKAAAVRAFLLLSHARHPGALPAVSETFAEEAIHSLAARGHRVTVYCRERHPNPSTEASPALPSDIRHKYLDTLAQTPLFSDLAITMQRYDALAVTSNDGECPLLTCDPRVWGCPFALNVDGLERNRKKWNRAAKKPWYRVFGMASAWDA